MNEEIYHNQFAKLYDYHIEGVEGDVEFYLDFFKDFKGNILEIGAGTGRITIPLAKQGHNITALDVSKDMLEILTNKAKNEGLEIPTLQADMRDFVFSNERFDAIIITFRSFQHMYSIADQLKALHNISGYLNPAGYLVFDVFNPSIEYIAKGDWQWRPEREINVPEKGLVKIENRNKYDMAKQLMSQETKYLIAGKEEVVAFEMRFFFRFEVELLLKVAGYDVVKLYGDFKKCEFVSGSPEMVWIVRQSG